MISEYSEKEWLLIDHFGFRTVSEHAFPPMIYSMMAIKAFTSNEQSPYVDSLRRCLLHLEAGKYRMTPEFENLIQVGEKPTVTSEHPHREFLDLL